MEVYLTKEFEKTPFLSDAYPYSLLTLKTRIMIETLLSEDHRDAIPLAIARLPRAVRAYGRNTLGKQIRVIAPDSVLKMIGMAALALCSLTFFVNMGQWVRQPRLLFLLTSWSESISSSAEDLTVSAVLWYAAALLLTWTSELDTAFTYAIRLRKWPKAMATYLIAASLWTPVALGLQALDPMGVFQGVRTLPFFILCGMLGAAVLNSRAISISALCILSSPPC